MRNLRPTISLLCTLAALAMPAAADASFTSFGSDLSAPATLDTAGAIQAGNHFGSDLFAWNTTLGNGSAPTSPAAGQITAVKVKGCTRLVPGAPPPPGVPFGGTEIHFQDLIPQPDGSLRVNATAGGFSLPACAPGGPDQNTVNLFHPVNLCVQAGDYVDFTDDGGFDPSDPSRYRNGVPFQVLASVAGSNSDAFVGDGSQESVFSPGYQRQYAGFSHNGGVELLLQATLATGADATPLCPGGRQGLPGPRSKSGRPAPPDTAVRLVHQNDGVNHRRYVRVAVYCRLPAGCSGTVALTTRVRKASAAAPKMLASHPFQIRGLRTAKLRLRLRPSTVAMIRAHKRRLPVSLNVTVGGKLQSQPINLKV